MPFYTYTDGEKEIELFLNMSEATEEKEIDDKIYKMVFEPSGNFILKGQGWASKGSALATKPKKYKEVGVKVDYNKKAEMEAAGEKF